MKPTDPNSALDGLIEAMEMRLDDEETSASTASNTECSFYSFCAQIEQKQGEEDPDDRCQSAQGYVWNGQRVAPAPHEMRKGDQAWRQHKQDLERSK
jgi:hypothetical protein